MFVGEGSIYEHMFGRQGVMRLLWKSSRASSESQARSKGGGGGESRGLALFSSAIAAKGAFAYDTEGDTIAAERGTVGQA